ncbi:MAG: hypothetical protein RJA05_1497, partial [Planctomycetota bacterium]
IVRTAANDTLYTANLSITYKVSGTSTPIQPGAFQYSIGPVPAPGAIALAGLVGLAGRRRR